MLGWPFLLSSAAVIKLTCVSCAFAVQLRHTTQPSAHWDSCLQMVSPFGITWECSWVKWKPCLIHGTCFFHGSACTNDYPNRCAQSTYGKNPMLTLPCQDLSRRSWALEGSNKLSGRLTASRQDVSDGAFGEENLDHLRRNSLKSKVFSTLKSSGWAEHVYIDHVYIQCVYIYI